MTTTAPHGILSAEGLLGDQLGSWSLRSDEWIDRGEPSLTADWVDPIGLEVTDLDPEQQRLIAAAPDLARSVAYWHAEATTQRKRAERAEAELSAVSDLVRRADILISLLLAGHTLTDEQEDELDAWIEDSRDTILMAVHDARSAP